MAFKVSFEAELDSRLKDELDFWGLSAEDMVRESMEHSLWGAIRRKTDNLCRRCKKPISSSIPPKDRTSGKCPGGFCGCR
jgi:hypothetical protein